MSTSVTLGGDKLGSGNEMKVHMHGFERSTHNLNTVLRTTMSAGTLVPIFNIVALPNDSFDIDMDVFMQTLPTVGQMLGSYKIQIDVFQTPMAEYNALLKVNANKSGLDMTKMKIPQYRLEGFTMDRSRDLDNQHVNPSCIFKYLGVSGMGFSSANQTSQVMHRWFNAIPWLIYWDKYNQYYAPKQEGIGAVIHNSMQEVEVTIVTMELLNFRGATELLENSNDNDTDFIWTTDTILFIQCGETGFERFEIERITISYGNENIAINELFNTVVWNDADKTITLSDYNRQSGSVIRTGSYTFDREPANNLEPKIVTFPLSNIDNMKMEIIGAVRNPNRFEITRDFDGGGGEAGTGAPYDLALKRAIRPNGQVIGYSATSAQEGLALKTYQSDKFNSWLDTEWISGAGGINEISAIQVVNNKIYISDIDMQSKVYKMLNRTAVSGGKYKDYIKVQYDAERIESISDPVYLGGLSKELVFDTVISQSASEGQPLGTIAGRGALTDKHKGGKVNVRTNEFSYITGIISITPRLDYSQGNDWDVNLTNFGQLHTPIMDEIGFQDLITDEMACWDTVVEHESGEPIFKSAGKQPAWINYMTNYNRVKGNFAIKNDMQWMTLTRRYTPEFDSNGAYTGIEDLTSIIDPSKFNYIFANTRRDAQNFQAQIGINITARRKMSARLMPSA